MAIGIPFQSWSAYQRKIIFIVMNGPIMIKNSTQHQWEQVEDPGPSFTHFVNTDGETQTIIVQTTNEPVQVTNATLHVQPEPRRKIYLESKKAKLEKEAKRNAFIEVVSAYKCRLCQFVAMFCQDVEQHLLDCHHEEYQLHH